MDGYMLFAFQSYDQNSLRVSPYRLLTTVAMPAFDRRPRIVSTLYSPTYLVYK
jgi:hypothetical protein